MNNLRHIAIRKVNFKLNYLMIIIIVSLLSMALYYSYAIFTVNKEKSGILNIIRGNLNYQITGDNIDNNTLTINKKTKTYINLNIKNLNSIKTSYALGIVGEQKDGITINYYLGTKNLPTGTINEYVSDNNSVTVTLVINNDTLDDEVIDFKVIGGFPEYTAVIPNDIKIIDKGIGAVGNIENIVLNDKLNNFEVDNSDEDYAYIKGSNPTNYLWYSGKLWRVLGVNKDNKSIKLVTEDIISSIYYGSSNFSSSYAYSWLNNVFYNSLRNPNDYLTDTVFNATKTDTDEKTLSTTLVTSKTGLINRYEYKKLGFLKNEKYFWLINPTLENKTVYVGSNNEISVSDTSMGAGIRPVISLKNSLNIIDGIGTKSNPYRLENDYDLNDSLKGNKLNTRYSGEYVKFDNKLFRIISINNGTIKLVSVNTIFEPIKFSNDDNLTNIYNNDSLVSDYLNNTWYKNLSLQEKSMINDTSLGIGVVNQEESYTNANISQITTKIALPVVGDIFTGYLSDDNKSYYTMTPSSNNKINLINSNGTLNTVTVNSNSYGIKVVLSLKDSATIINGNGTFNSPFTFEEDAKEIIYPTALSTLILDESRLGSGRLLSMEEDTFIVGTNPNNYVWYSGKLWRVTSIITKTISEENKEDRYIKQVKLITEEPITVLPSYNNSYSTDFATSYAYSWLNEEFYNTLRNPTHYLVTEYYYNATSSTNNNEPNNTIMINSKVGLLNRYEYGKITTDMNLSENYLNNKSPWWLITPYSSTNINYINDKGQIENTRSSSENTIRPTIVIRGDLLVTEGAGSYSKPYRLEKDDDTSEEIVNDKLNTRYSGEYIKFNDILYRIIKIENNLIKIVSLDIDSNNKYSFSSDSNWNNSFSSTHSGNYLNTTWYNNLPSEYQNLIMSSTWYLGIVKDGESYKCATTTCTSGSVLTASSKVGLLRSGELFSSYIGTDTKIDNRFWTLTGTSTTNVKSIGINNSITEELSTNKHGLRPVIYLKENVTINKGTGTLSNPFILNT